MKKVFCLGIIFLSLLFAVYPEVVIGAAGEALGLCAHHIVPSLFPFLVCANALLSEGFAEKAGKLFSRGTKRVFRIGGEGSAAIVLGFLSGYPAGAIVSGRLYGEGYIKKCEAERLLGFTNNPGPLFVLGTVGTALYGDKRVGVILYVSLLLSALITGVLMRFYGKDESVLKRKEHKMTRDPMGDAVSTVLMLSGYIVFFSVILAFSQKAGLCDFLVGVFEGIGMSQKTASLLSVGIFEISQAVKMGGALPVMAGLLSFGGISVLLQTGAVLKKVGLSIKPYLLGKSISAVISAFVCTLLLKFFPVSASASVMLSRPVPSVSFMTVSVLLSSLVYTFFSVLSKKST